VEGCWKLTDTTVAVACEGEFLDERERHKREREKRTGMILFDHHSGKIELLNTKLLELK